MTIPPWQKNFSQFCNNFVTISSRQKTFRNSVTILWQFLHDKKLFTILFQFCDNSFPIIFLLQFCHNCVTIPSWLKNFFQFCHNFLTIPSRQKLFAILSQFCDPPFAAIIIINIICLLNDKHEISFLSKVFFSLFASSFHIKLLEFIFF